MSLDEKVLVLLPDHPVVKYLEKDNRERGFIVDTTPYQDSETSDVEDFFHNAISLETKLENQVYYQSVIYPEDHPDFAVIARKYAETDESMKQLIPYSVVVKAPKDKRLIDEYEILVYMRKPHDAAADKRLEGKWSIGFGGHMNPVDMGALEDWVVGTVSRELNEEIGMFGPLFNNSEIISYGFLFDKTNPIGRVHLGLLVSVILPGDSDEPVEFESTEDGIELKGFHKLGDLFKLMEEEPDKFENWSKDAIIALRDEWTKAFNKPQE